MRARQLRRRDASLVRSAHEQDLKPSPWGKLVYFSFLTGVLAMSFWWGYERAVYIKGVGFLKTRVTALEAIAAGQIAEIKCEINDQVKLTQPLVFFTDSLTVRRGSASSDEYATERRIIDTRKKIRAFQQRAQHQRRQTRRLEGELASGRELLQQHAITIADYREVEERLRLSQFELGNIQIELEAERQTLRSYEHEVANVLARRAPVRHLVQRAPTAGIVSAVFKQPGEVVRLGEPILEILNEEQDFITSFFEGEFEKSLAVGERVAVHFENGDAYSGRIRRIYPSTLPQPPEISHRFGKVRRFIIAEVVPEETSVWRRIYDTQAEVRVERRWVNSIRLLKDQVLNSASKSVKKVL